MSNQATDLLTRCPSELTNFGSVCSSETEQPLKRRKQVVIYIFFFAKITFTQRTHTEAQSYIHVIYFTELHTHTHN